MKRRGGVQIALGAAAMLLLSVGAAWAAEPPMPAPTCHAVAADASWADCAASLEAQALGPERAAQHQGAAVHLQAAAPLVPGIPEPPTVVMMLAGIAAIAFMATRRRRD